MASRPGLAAACLTVSAVVSFNGGVWQLCRRSWKESVLESHANMKKTPLEELPKAGEPVEEFMPVEVRGTLDNEGSVIVGPRPVPNRQQSPSQDERRGGFVVLTPFEMQDGQVVMINRGWVPIDACKSRVQLMQYTGEGFKETVVKGIIRRQETLSSWVWGENLPANREPVMGNTWAAMRPFESTMNYYARRYGADQMLAQEEKHGARHYVVEMVEDHSGTDQYMVKGNVFPLRRLPVDMMYTSITPGVHTMYASFWFMVSLGSVYGLRRLFVDQRRAAALFRVTSRSTEAVTKARAEQSEAFYEEVQRVAGTSGGNASQLRMSAHRPKVPAPDTPASKSE